MSESYFVLYDSRWTGNHGIGRFASELKKYLQPESEITGGDPLSPTNLIASSLQLIKKKPDIYFSPGFNPPLYSPVPFVFTIHDLIHLHVRSEMSRSKSIYYDYIIKPRVHRAAYVLTDSEYSRAQIMQWSGAAPEKVIVVGCGVGAAYSESGPVHKPGYPYILYVGNRRPHKNIPRLLEAFALLSPEVPDVRLMLSGPPDDETRHLALRLGIFERLVFAGLIPEEELPAYYRGASVVTLPSLYEGFGLPPLEAMACGTPVVVSETTSLPEVVGCAGVLIDPLSVESLAQGLRRALTDSQLRGELREAGLERAKQFTWQRVGQRVEQILGSAVR